MFQLTMIPGASHHCIVAVALTNTVALTKKPTRLFLNAKNKHAIKLCFSSSSEPPYSGEEKYAAKHREMTSYTSSGTSIAEVHTRWPSARASLRHHEKTISRSKKLRRRLLQEKNSEHMSSLVHSSQYSYRIICSGKEKIQSTLDSSDSVRHNKSEGFDAKRVLKTMNASALLDPLKFCKGSVKLPPYAHSGSRSISGTDAARRLLSGKRDFISEASKLDKAPVLLDGHGVPPALFQHCVDMAGALLRHYGENTVECSFHNKYGSRKKSGKAPHHVKVRRRDANNAFLPPPSAIGTEEENSGDGHGNAVKIDWDYNLTLYLTVMVSSKHFPIFKYCSSFCPTNPTLFAIPPS